MHSLTDAITVSCPPEPHGTAMLVMLNPLSGPLSFGRSLLTYSHCIHPLSLVRTYVHSISFAYLSLYPSTCVQVFSSSRWLMPSLYGYVVFSWCIVMLHNACRVMVPHGAIGIVIHGVVWFICSWCLMGPWLLCQAVTERRCLVRDSNPGQLDQSQVA